MVENRLKVRIFLPLPGITIKSQLDEFQPASGASFRTADRGRDLLRSQRLTRIEVESDTSN